METTDQQTAPPPCACQSQTGASLLWVAGLLIIVVGIDRWIERYSRKRKKEAPLSQGAEHGGKG